MGRCPASASRTRIHAGAGATRKPSKRWATKRRQSGESIATSSASPFAARARPGFSGDGARSSRPYDAASSRARPTTDIESGRLAVISTSSTAVSSPNSSTTSMPAAIEPSSCMMPSSNHSGGNASSSAEIIMPCDATPRIVRASIVSCGSRAPMVATAIVCPAATLVAAVAMVSGAAPPASTCATSSRSALGCLSTDASLAVTTPEIAGRRSMPSTGNPSIARRSAIASASPGRSTYSRSQLIGTRIETP